MDDKELYCKKCFLPIKQCSCLWSGESIEISKSIFEKEILKDLSDKRKKYKEEKEKEELDRYNPSFDWNIRWWERPATKKEPHEDEYNKLSHKLSPKEKEEYNSFNSNKEVNSSEIDRNKENLQKLIDIDKKIQEVCKTDVWNGKTPPWWKELNGEDLKKDFKNEEKQNEEIPTPYDLSTVNSYIRDGNFWWKKEDLKESEKKSLSQELSKSKSHISEVFRLRENIKDYKKKSLAHIDERKKLLEIIDKLSSENKKLKYKINLIETDPEAYKRRMELDPYDEENWEEYDNNKKIKM